MSEPLATAPTRKVGILLGIGIFLLPIIFSWFTLRKGHSVLSRVLSFGWLAITILVFALGGGTPSEQQRISPTPTIASPPETQAPAAPKASVNLANYQRLETGMTYEEVVAILGKPGTEISSNELAGIKTVMYQWEAGFGANMNAMFQDGGLVQKAQFGLR